jgi:hypothetical protein
MNPADSNSACDVPGTHTASMKSAMIVFSRFTGEWLSSGCAAMQPISLPAYTILNASRRKLPLVADASRGLQAVLIECPFNPSLSF